MGEIDAARGGVVSALLGEDFSEPELIASGAGSLVYRAVQRSTGRFVAVKLLLGARSAPDDAPLNEAVALGRVSWHPNVLSLYDVRISSDGIPMLVTEFAPRGSAESLRTSGLPLSDALRLSDDLLAALGAAHDAGVVHCDLKPSNLLIALDGTGRLADFGIARILGGDESTLDDVVASLAYVAPEVLENSPPTVLSDIYAAALTIWSLTEGRIPFEQTEAPGMLSAKLGLHPIRFDAIRRGGTPGHERLAGLLEAAAGPDPNLRPTATHLRDALGDVLRPPPSYPRDAGPNGDDGGRRRRNLVLIGLTVLAGLLGFVAGATRPQSSAAPTPTVEAFCRTYALSQERIRGQLEEAPTLLESSPTATATARILIKDLPQRFSSTLAPPIEMAREIPAIADAAETLTPPALSSLAVADGLFALFRDGPLIGRDGSIDLLVAPPGLRPAASAYTRLNQFVSQKCENAEWNLGEVRARLVATAKERLQPTLKKLFDDPTSVQLFDASTLAMLFDAVPQFVDKQLAGRADWLYHLLEYDETSRVLLLTRYPDTLLRAIKEDAGLASQVRDQHALWLEDETRGLRALESSRRAGIQSFYADQLRELGLNLDPADDTSSPGPGDAPSN